jgi:transcriptional antiterminator NusG
MSIYAVQVKTRDEEKFIKLFAAWHREEEVSIYFPKRVLRVRRQGKITTIAAPVFSGYIFADPGEEERLAGRLWELRKTGGFLRFLPSTIDARPLQGGDLETVLHFIRLPGQTAGVSKVCFDENARIVVKEGPLLGLEGRIVKVDRRKGRAKIRLDIYENSFTIDMAFETLEPGSVKK